eukprot:361674-Chlamydomonas_euryale.AAC.2
MAHDPPLAPTPFPDPPSSPRRQGGAGGQGPAAGRAAERQEGGAAGEAAHPGRDHQPERQAARTGIRGSRRDAGAGAARQRVPRAAARRHSARHGDGVGAVDVPGQQPQAGRREGGPGGRGRRQGRWDSGDLEAEVADLEAGVGDEKGGKGENEEWACQPGWSSRCTWSLAGHLPSTEKATWRQSCAAKEGDRGEQETGQASAHPLDSNGVSLVTSWGGAQSSHLRSWSVDLCPQPLYPAMLGVPCACYRLGVMGSG